MVMPWQIEYYELLMGDRALFADSGVMVVDNTLWYSRVLRPVVADESAETRSVAEFGAFMRTVDYFLRITMHRLGGGTFGVNRWMCCDS
jgi:hypothetical protein